MKTIIKLLILFCLIPATSSQAQVENERMYYEQLQNILSSNDSFSVYKLDIQNMFMEQSLSSLALNLTDYLSPGEQTIIDFIIPYERDGEIGEIECVGLSSKTLMSFSGRNLYGLVIKECEDLGSDQEIEITKNAINWY